MAKAITQILTHTSEQNGIKPLTMQWKDSTSDPTLLGSMTEALEEETVHQDNKEEEEDESYCHLLTHNKNRQIEGKRLHSPEVKIFYGDKPFQVVK